MSNLILPYRPLPPEGTGVLATRLDDVLARLPGLGIRLNPASRLPQAARLLRAVEEANAYPSAEPDLLRVTNAVKAAFNFVRVIDAIRSPGPPGMLESLRRAAKGTLDDAGPTPAHRAQSELFFGVATVAGGAKTGAPKPGGRKTPDFVTEVDTLRYSVEVKRPGSVNTVQDKVAEAVRQIRAGTSRIQALLPSTSRTCFRTSSVSNMCLPPRAGTNRHFEPRTTLHVSTLFVTHRKLVIRAWLS